MTFTAFDILTWTIIYLQYFVVAKIVIRDKVLHLKEGLYIIATSLSMAIGILISITVFNIDGTISSIAIPLFCMIYFYKIKCYSIAKTFTLTFISAFIITINDVFVMVVVNFFFPSFLPSIPNFPLPVGLSLNPFLQFAAYILFTYTLSVLATFLVVKATKKQRDLINQSNRTQTILAGISLFSMVVNVIASNLWRHLGATLEFLWTVPLFGIVIFVLVSVTLYARFLREQMALQQKEAEQEALQYYIQQIEQQQAAMRKFKHDYQNILYSLYDFIKEKDLDGLERYYTGKIEVASETITKSDFALENLSKIKMKEIKGILAAKLMLAQNLGIDTTFEATDEIDHIPMDSVALVRMLGIILDNAIEELETLGEGKLQVACYRVGTSITFVTQNTCRSDMPKLHELRQTGFSTKGKGRGLGLSNLSEIANAYPNITLDTAITTNKFVQKLTIGESEWYTY